MRQISCFVGSFVWTVEAEFRPELIGLGFECQVGPCPRSQGVRGLFMRRDAPGVRPKTALKTRVK
jgi:hypothetical protein